MRLREVEREGAEGGPTPVGLRVHGMWKGPGCRGLRAENKEGGQVSSVPGFL